MDLRILIGPAGVTDLAELYAPPTRPWLRANMVSTVDGSAQGADGLSGSINNDADHQVFMTLRESADCLIVGAGTVRAEGYGRPVRADGSPLPILVVTKSGAVPEQLVAGAGLSDGRVLVATIDEAPGLGESRALLGQEHVLSTQPTPSGGVDPVALRAWLIERGHTNLLTEGGPSLLNDLLAAGVVDELCLTWVPLLVGGDGVRISPGSALSAELSPYVLVESGGTLLGRWFLNPVT